MKRVLSLLFTILTIALSALAKGDNMLKYDITGAGSGNEGMVLVKVERLVVQVRIKKRIQINQLQLLPIHNLEVVL